MMDAWFSASLITASCNQVPTAEPNNTGLTFCRPTKEAAILCGQCLPALCCNCKDDVWAMLISSPFGHSLAIPHLGA
jgi:hypothetical protein